ncbi:MAG: MCE family protein [Actinobacteria bacterium]|nr:MCE family protein [Actinomycetota bacterium]
MKSFTERNPRIIGAILIAIILGFTTGALLLTSGVVKGEYTVMARFVDTAGLKGGDKVRVAGVSAGSVGSIRQAGGKVEVALKINKGIELSRDTKAQVIVETLLGSKYVRLVTGRDWTTMLHKGSVITDTSSPTEVLDLQNIGTPLLQKIDAKAFNDLLASLSSVTKDKRDEVVSIIGGLNKVTAQVNDRQDQTRGLIDAAKKLSGTLAGRDNELVGLVDNLNVVVRSLADQRVQLAALLQQTAAAAKETADLVGANRAKLDSVLDELHQDLVIVGRHQVDLAQSIAYLGVAIQGFSSIGYSGPDNNPNRWANVFAQGLGPTSVDPILGSCGVVDQALDLALGNDPLPCSARTGPLPGQSTSPASAGAKGRATVSTAAQIHQSLDMLLAPVLRGAS